jgi:hypothetical protein
MSHDGYVHPRAAVSYVRIVPRTASEQPDSRSQYDGVVKLTVTRCLMLSQKKVWFLSEMDEEQPGTDRDVDFY